MHAKIDCFACIVSQFAKLSKRATSDEDQQYLLARKLMRLMLDAPRTTPPPEFAGEFYRWTAEISGVDDPYREAKDKSTELGLRLLPELRKTVAASADPFETAVRFAIGGNIIDYGVFPDFDLDRAAGRILEVLNLPFDRGLCAEMKRRMDRAEHIFYMLDNCGEAVIDRLLIEPYQEKIIVGVRGKPILNDATRREAALSGISGVPIVDTGDMVPGVSLRNSSSEFLETMRGCDLVVTKGQGNFESLDNYDRPIFHLLRIKCDVVARALHSPVGALKINAENL